MSHFNVLVIGNNIKEQLAPFQENNMGDCPKEFLAFNDRTAELQEEYETDSTERIIMPDGRMLDTWDKEFSVILDAKRPHCKTNVVPKELERKDIPYKKLFASFDEYAEYLGETKDEESGLYGYWENPNAKWDWYQVGGRWSGELVMKPKMLLPDTEIRMNELGFTAGEMNQLFNMFLENTEKFNKVISKYQGREQDIRSIMEMWVKTAYPKACRGERSWMNTEVCIPPNHCDIAQKKDIDYEAMCQPYREQAEKNWEFLEKWHKLSEEEQQNPEVGKVLCKEYGYMFRLPKKLENDTQDSYIERNSQWTPYAILWDGKWISQGDMGWFGMSTTTDCEWGDTFKELFDSLADDETLTVVDCHI